MRFLLAWELGGGLGHTVPLVRIAEKLWERGHAVDFALRDVTTLDQALSIVGADISAPRRRPRVWQAPHWDDDLANEIPLPASHAELLLHAGYHDPAVMRWLYGAWCELIDAASPALVLGDNAPTAVWAGGGVTLTARIANGFFMPSVKVQSFREGVDETRLSQAMHRAVATMRVVDPFVVPAPDQDFLVTVPELDHFPARAAAGAEYLGLITERGLPGPPHADFGVYLKADSAWHGILEMLPPNAPALVYVPGSYKVGKPFRAAEVRYLICHGGAGLVAEALQAGRPVLILPQTYEQWLLGQRVEALGAGILVNGPNEFERLEVALKDIRDPSYAEAAQAFAAKYPWRDVASDIADRLVALGS